MSDISDEELLLVLERLRELDERSGELRGGVLPLIPMIIGAITGTASVAAKVLPKVLPRILAGIARGVRGVGSITDDVLARTARSLESAAARTGAIARARLASAKPVSRIATRTAKTEGKALRQGIYRKMNAGLTLTGIANMAGMEGDEDYTGEEEPTTTLQTAPIRQVRRGRPLPPPEEILPEEDEEEDTTPPPPLPTYTYNPRIRNVYEVGASVNPLSEARNTSTLLARRRGGGATHRKRFLKKMGLPDKSYSLTELAKISGIPKKTLQEVYNRGTGAYKTNPQSVRMKGTFKKDVDAPMSQKLTKEQWSMARVYSFLNGSKKHDTDLR